MVGPCALWKTDSIIVILNVHARAVLIVMKEQNSTLNQHITIRARKNRIIKTLYITSYSNLTFLYLVIFTVIDIVEITV